MLFPRRNVARHASTGLDLEWSQSGLPQVTWLGHVPSGVSAHDLVAAQGLARRMPLLGEHGHVRYTRPHLRGHRLGPDGTAGRAWSTRFITDTSVVEDDWLHLSATDADAQLRVQLELESLPGGSLRGRWTLTNCGATAYVVERP